MKKLLNTAIQASLFFLLIVVNTNYLSAQDTKKLSSFALSINGGATLFWGDLSDDVTNPFSKYFTNEQGYAFGVIGTYFLNPVFDVNVQVEAGSLKGNRQHWGGNVTADYSFEGNFTEFNFNIGLDLFNLFMPNRDDRLINLYFKGGVGYTLFNSTETNHDINKVYPAVKGGSLVIPGGGGIRVKINKNLSFYFENTFTYAFSDELDGHIGSGSESNDIYNYTSLGATYRLNEKPKKIKIKTYQEVPVDTLLATNIVDETKPMESAVEVFATMPNIINSTDTFEINLRINIASLNEKARLQQTLPIGMMAVENNSSEALFGFNDQVVSFIWNSIKSDNSSINLKYNVYAINLNQESYTLPGIFFYDKNGVEKIVQFKETILVTKPNIAIIEKQEPEIINTKTAQEVEPTKVDGLVYKVQVQAIYNGKSSVKAVAKANKLDLIVEEEVAGAYTKYTAGNYSTYEEAKVLKDKLRAGQNQGAFVVAYYKGKRITVQEALEIQTKGGINSSIEAPISSENKIEGITYKIQISASTRSQSITKLQSSIGSNDRITETKHLNLYKYLIGNYSLKTDADAKLKEVQVKIPDAFIVRFKNGIRQ